VSTYVHLSPLRARIVEEGALRAYRWSSYPAYLAAAGARPGWLRVDRVLAALELGDTAGGRRAYAGHIGQRSREAMGGDGASELRRQWEAIRRGWCLGSEGFRVRMKQRLDGLLAANRAASYAGPAVEEHRRRSAEELLALALEAAGLSADELPVLRKTDARKQALAWLLRKNTTVSNRWVSERLYMGHEVNVSQSVRRVEAATHDDLARWRKTVCKTLKSKD
jgi:hypothetical protein